LSTGRISVLVNLVIRKNPFHPHRKGLLLLGMATVASSKPREALPSNSSLGIAIPIFGNSPRASGGSGEGGRGVGEENVKV